MKVLPVSLTMFKGREVSYASKNGEAGIKQLKGFYPDSTIVKTLDAYHMEERNKVYFADPMEKISDSTRDRVDFIVYDNEPSYPTLEEVKENYLGNNRTNYRDNFEGLREYYYRREMGGHDDVNLNKFQQWQAAECTGLYDKAGDLRYQKETAEDELKMMLNDISEINDGIEDTKKELGKQIELNKSLNSHLNKLEETRVPYERVNALAGQGANTENEIYNVSHKRVMDSLSQEAYRKELESTDYYNNGLAASPKDKNIYAKYSGTTKTFGDIEKIEGSAFKLASKKDSSRRQLNLIEKTISDFRQLIETSNRTIAEMKSYMGELRIKRDTVTKQINEKRQFIDECIEKLRPLFDELANFYKSQGIKVIKK